MHKLLILHDQVGSIQKLGHLFEQDYYCLTATSAQEALTLLERYEVAVVIADQRMNAQEFFKASAELRPQVIRLRVSTSSDVDELISAVNSGLVHAHIRTPVSNEELRLTVHRAVLRYEENKRVQGLIASNARLQLRLRQAKLTFVRSLSAVLRVRDEVTHARGLRVSECADVLAAEFLLNEGLREDLKAAALLHEISILTANLLGVGDLESSEMNARSVQLLSCFPDLLDAADVVRFQRENFDGSARPTGLRGEQIPIASRILRVASEYDSLLQPRDETLALRHDEAIKVLRREAGKNLDGRVVEALSCVELKERKGFQRPASLVEVETISQAIH